MRLLATSGLFFTLVLAGCGSGEGSPGGAPADSSGEMGSAGDGSVDESAEPTSAVELTLEGMPEALSGNALLEVRELNPVVNLVITTVFPSNDADLVRLQLGVMGVDRAMGTHSEQFTGDGSSTALAIVSIGGVSYTSQSGSLEVTLSGDGAIEGRFDAELAPDLAGSSAEAAVSAEPLSISGRLAGTWLLKCSSPVLGLPGDHSVSDSAYCRGLQF